jgi:hypothetical protein
MSIHALIGITVLVLIPGLLLTFTWLQFLQRKFNDPRSRLTQESPLFAVTGSYLLFLGLLALPLTIKDQVTALIWSNAVLDLAMSILALTGKHSLRWRLVGLAAAVSFVWLVVGFSILGVESAGGWGL